MSSEESGNLIFGIGSIAFAPRFAYEERMTATLAGWSRTFGHPSVRNWGRDTHPAPTCGLVEGGSVTGVAYRLGSSSAPILEGLVKRENGPPQQVTVELMDGNSRPAWVWPMSNAWGDKSLDELARYALGNIRNGGGPYGDAWDYVSRLNEVFTELGIFDPVTNDYFFRLQTRLDG